MSGSGFDLREQGWIPVRAETGRKLVGFRDLLVRAHALTDVDLPLPPAAAGLWRVLYLLAARVTGLDNRVLSRDAWYDRRDEVLAAGRFTETAVDAYFGEYTGRFDLFDRDRPWLQDPRLADQCPKSSGVNKLVLGRPSGSNQVWFNHQFEPGPVPAAEAAWHLLAALYYGPSGRCTTRTVGNVSEANTTAGPLRSVLSCHPIGRTVFESLVVGIPFPGRRDRSTAPDRAPWEAEGLPDPLLPQPVGGLAGALTGRFQHAVLLVPDAERRTVIDGYLTWAWRRKIDEGAVDPYLIYQSNKSGQRYARYASAERALWRDVDALLLEDVGDAHASRPDVLGDIVSIDDRDLVDALCVRAFGFDQDGQTRDKQFFSAATPPVLRWLKSDDGTADHISDVRKAGDQVARDLERALRVAWARLSDPAGNDNVFTPRPDAEIGQWPARAAGQYWPLAERVFWQSIHTSRDENPAKPFISLAARIYDRLSDEVAVSPRAAKALALERRRIFRALHTGQHREAT